MTKKEYETYKEAVRKNLEGLEFISSGATSNCDGCGLGDDPTQWAVDAASEGSFSWSSCDGCGSGLGGQRYPAHACMRDADGNEETVHLDLCTDCLYFLEYGRLDDEQMLDIEKEEA